jgi:hypothetical protein
MTKVREPSSIVEMAEMCRKAQSLIKTIPNVDPETAVVSEAILATLAEADFYELNTDLIRAVDQMYEELFAGKSSDTLILDHDCRLPSSVCVFWSPKSLIRFSNADELYPFAYYAVEDDEGRTFVYHISPYFAPLVQGGYKVGMAESVVTDPRGTDDDQQLRVSHVLTVAAICSLINQPSFTKREPAGSRQERRAASRSGGYATDAWHKVTWNIGEEVKAKLTRDEPVRCMPLHYTRGHWRKAEEGWKNTTQRKDGLWYQWIEGFWSGHPAFGIKKSYHAPRMGDAA